MRLGATVPTEGWSHLSEAGNNSDYHHLYRRTSKVDTLRWAIDQFAPVRKAWVTWMEPGGYLVPHVDAGKPPGYPDRWQIVIQSSGWYELPLGVRHHPADGDCLQFQQWEPHQVVNDGDRPRIVCVIDRDVIVRPPGPLIKIQEDQWPQS